MNRFAEACGRIASLSRLVLRVSVASCYMWLYSLLDHVWHGHHVLHFSLVLVAPSPAPCHGFFLNKVFHGLLRDAAGVPPLQNLYLDLSLLPLATGGVFRLMTAIGRLGLLRSLWLILDRSDLCGGATQAVTNAPPGLRCLEYAGFSLCETQLTTPGLCNMLRFVASQPCRGALRRLDVIAVGNALHRGVWSAVRQALFDDRAVATPWTALNHLVLEFSQNPCGPCDVVFPVATVLCKPNVLDEPHPPTDCERQQHDR